LVDKFFLFDQPCACVLPFIVQIILAEEKLIQTTGDLRIRIVGNQSLRETKNHLEERGKENAYNGVSGKTD
jgi:hypothetical protein